MTRDQFDLLIGAIGSSILREQDTKVKEELYAILKIILNSNLVKHK